MSTAPTIVKLRVGMDCHSCRHFRSFSPHHFCRKYEIWVNPTDLCEAGYDGASAEPQSDTARVATVGEIILTKLDGLTAALDRIQRQFPASRPATPGLEGVSNKTLDPTAPEFFKDHV